MFIVLSLLSFFVLSWILMRSYRNYALKTGVLDKPNLRSSHKTPTPIGGGIVILGLWISFLVVLFLIGRLSSSFFWAIVPGSVLIGLIGYLDDRYDVPARYRLLVHLCVAVFTAVLIGGFPYVDLGIIKIHLGWLGYFIVIFALGWSINLYNFMDGIDGIAGVEALFVFCFGGYFIWVAGGDNLAMIIWVLASTIVGFLVWNKPKAKLFLGDVGSGVLGLLVVVFGLLGQKYYNVPILLWMILYGVFWFDSGVTLIRRILNGEKWYQAHRSHAYQRLQLKNWSHGKILLYVILINCVLSFLALLANYQRSAMLIYLSLAIILLTVMYLLVEKQQPMFVMERKE